MRLEERDDGRVALFFCDGQRRIAGLCRPVDLRAFVQQQPRRVDVALHAGDDQRRLPVLVRPIDLRAVLQQQPQQIARRRWHRRQVARRQRGCHRRVDHGPVGERHGAAALPRDIILIISKMHPLLIPPFTNKTLRRAVKDYLAGGDRKRIVEKYGEISTWDTSKVTNMYGLFCGATSFNQPLNKWDVSKVTNMEAMFWGATSFNQPLNKWNVSKVTDMSFMFEDARSFNQPLNNWNVSNVEYMEGMFQNAISFNQPLHAPWYAVEQSDSE